MAILLEEQFRKLSSIIRKSNLYWSGNEQYTGPINPTGIVNMILPKNNFNVDVNFLIVGERVPLKFFPHADGYPDCNLGIVFADLNERFELKNYDIASKRLSQISGLGCKQGTIRGLIRSEKYADWYILYHKYIS
jgi:hypothetical protein